MVVVEPVLAEVALNHEVSDRFVTMPLLAVTIDVKKSLVVKIFFVFVLFRTFLYL